MRTKLLILAGLAAVAVAAVAVAPSLSTAADPKGKTKAEAAKTDAPKSDAPAGPYDPATAKGANPAEFKKMEAALPTEAPAKPAKPRKLLVFVGTSGLLP